MKRRMQEMETAVVWLGWVPRGALSLLLLKWTGEKKDNRRLVG